MSVFTGLRELAVGFIQPSEMVCCFDDSIASLEIRDDVTKRRKICVSFSLHVLVYPIDRRKITSQPVGNAPIHYSCELVKCVPDASEQTHTESER